MNANIYSISPSNSNVDIMTLELSDAEQILVKLILSRHLEQCRTIRREQAEILKDRAHRTQNTGAISQAKREAEMLAPILERLQPF